MGIPKSTLHNAVCKRLCLAPYKVQLLHEIKTKYKNKRVGLQFAATMLDEIEENNDFLENLLFTDEVTFHVSGSVNWHYCRI